MRKGFILRMGKYMRKTKISGEVAVMEVPAPHHHQSSPLGVRTRARTLALQRQRLQKPAATSSTEDPFSYLQLRSRRLEKHFASPAASRTKPVGGKSATQCHTPHPSHKASNNNNEMEDSPVNSGSMGSVSMRSCCSKKAKAVPVAVPVAAPVAVCEEALEIDAGMEASFGENVLELEAQACRNARETTPCSLIRDPEAMRTPGSTTRPNKSTASTRRIRTPLPGNIPTSLEMEEFFSGPEQVQQKIFAEKYNFDPVNDQPLAGRYEWEKLDA